MNHTKLILLLSLTLSQVSIADDVYSEQFQRISSTNLYEVVESENGEQEVLIQSVKSADFHELAFSKEQLNKINSGGVLMAIKGMIGLGKQIYEIVKKGKPVVNINSKPVEILAIDEDGLPVPAMQMAGWRAPTVKKYRVKTQNYLGMAPASFDFMLIYSYGGQYRGVGRYITGAQIKTTKVNVKWGYTLDANFSLTTITNEGTDSSPVAGAILSMKYTISTVLQEYGEDKTFYINGKGETTAY